MHYKAAVMTSLVDLVFVEVMISTRQTFLEGMTKTTHHLSPFSQSFTQDRVCEPTITSLNPFVLHDAVAEVSDINLLFI